jgi:hypothetical protein
MKEKKILSEKFQKFNNCAFEELNTINGGSINTTTQGLGGCHPDQWYLFKKNNPTNTFPDGTSSSQDDHTWVDVSEWVDC